MRPDQFTLLLVDDDPVNLEILDQHLMDAGYRTLTATRGQEALDILLDTPGKVHAVLLDRMMPEMDGMEVLAKMKSLPSFSMVPVVIQTAAASPEQVREGIEAGAFYYLTKPFTKEVLLAIVQAALGDYVKYEFLRLEVAMQSEGLQCLEIAQFRFQTMGEASTLALLLANACPDPARVVTGLTDLLLNAVEHGNLRLTYDEKTQLQEAGTWEQEIERRLSLPEFADKRATVRFQKTPEHIEFVITDQGMGFNWQRYMEISPELAFSSHGRGVALARAISFDTMEYRGVGNEVVCTINLAKASPAAQDACATPMAMQRQ